MGMVYGAVPSPTREPEPSQSLWSLLCIVLRHTHTTPQTTLSATPCFDPCYISTLSSREDRHVVHGAKKKFWVVVGGGVALGLATPI
jgi:hypothetical protein